MMRTILLIDDNEAVLDAMERLFSREGWAVLRAESGEAGLEKCARGEVDLVLQDLDLPGIGGIELLETLLARAPEVPVIVLTGHGDISLAVDAMRAGAEGFLPKPTDLAHLSVLAEKAYEKGELRRENRRLIRGQSDQNGLRRLEESPALRPLADQVRAVSRTDSTVLLQGETGTGKGWMSRMIHSLSPRSERPFIEINCAGLSPTLLESELFGHVKGAFTGASARKEGLFMAAHRGTLFLDEIADLEPGLQPKLLKAIESSYIRPVGGTRTTEVDVRVITATNRALEDEVQAGRFREDLYYRLAVYPIRLPPLRERGAQQIMSVAYDLLTGLTARSGHGPYRISNEALEIFIAYPWPGNIREMRNVLERGLITAKGEEEIRPAHLSMDLRRARSVDGGFDPELPLAEVEKRHILRSIDHHEGNRSRAARALGIGRRTLYDKLKRYESDD